MDLSIHYFNYNGNMENKEIVNALAALAQTHRLAAFRALVVAGPAGLTPGQLAEQLEIPANTLSFHLKELSHAGLVGHTRQGRSLIYRADFGRMGALMSYLTANCCEGASCGLPAESTCAC
jgi:predicted transcriptional regulator